MSQYLQILKTQCLCPHNCLRLVFRSSVKIFDAQLDKSTPAAKDVVQGGENVPGIVFTIYIFVFYLRLMSQN